MRLLGRISTIRSSVPGICRAALMVSATGALLALSPTWAQPPRAAPPAQPRSAPPPLHPAPSPARPAPPPARLAPPQARPSAPASRPVTLPPRVTSRNAGQPLPSGQFGRGAQAIATPPTTVGQPPIGGQPNQAIHGPLPVASSPVMPPQRGEISSTVPRPPHSGPGPRQLVISNSFNSSLIAPIAPVHRNFGVVTFGSTVFVGRVPSSTVPVGTIVNSNANPTTVIFVTPVSGGGAPVIVPLPEQLPLGSTCGVIGPTAILGAPGSAGLIPQDCQQAQAPLIQMATAPTGQALVWENPPTGVKGTITPKNDPAPTGALMADGSKALCRSFDAETALADGPSQTTGIVCRDETGDWKVQPIA
jgi:surface antigen